MSAWTEDRITRLKLLWPQGHSATWIAADLGGGLTRNAVLAKVWRLELSVGRHARPGHSTRGVRPPATNAAMAPPDTGGVSILTVGPCDCRWPYGDPLKQGFLVCGRQISRGAYCEAHAVVAYRASPQGVERLRR